MRKRIIFKGTVQHVGFRFRAITAAKKLGLTGWVMNLPDGTVIMEAQGTEEALDLAVRELCRSNYGKIEASMTDIPEGDEREFRVRLH